MGIEQDENLILCIDESWSDDSAIGIRGWILGKNGGLDQVEICVGGTCVPITSWHPRPDVAAAFPEYYSQECGFIAHLNPTDGEYQFSFHAQVQGKTLSKTVTLTTAEANKLLEEAIAYYRRAIEMNPNHYEFYERLAEALTQQGKIDEVSSIYHKISIFLAEQGQIKEAVDCFQKTYRTQPTEGKIYEYIWKGLNQLESFDVQNPYCKGEIKSELAQEYFSQSSQYNVIDFNDLTEENRKFIESRGWSLANLKIIKEDNNALEEIYINTFDRDKSFKLARKEKKNHHLFGFGEEVNQTRDFQQSIVETGYIYTVCPKTGQVLRSNQSFYLYLAHGGVDVLIYRFVGVEVFYLIVSLWFGGKMFIYFPKCDTLIYLTSNYKELVNEKTVINKLKGILVSSWNKVLSYISSEEPKQVVATPGSTHNLGHYFWNKIAGLEYFYMNGILDRIKKIFAVSHSYLEIHHIFPEISPDNIIYTERENILGIILENNYLAVLPTDITITEPLAARIYQASIKLCNPDFLKQVEQSKEYFPLLLINIRSHNKVWISQVEGYANIINTLHQDYPNMAVIFDGFSSEKPNMDRILALIHPEIKTYNALECSIQESIVWAYAIDTYISVVGSGLVLVTWIANKPGVAHSETAHLHQASWWGQVRENTIPPVFIPKEFIVDHGQGGWCNYEVDWKIIYDEVIKIVKQLR